jgi:hypothetical protein
MSGWLLLKDELAERGRAVAVAGIEPIAGLPESDIDQLAVAQAVFNGSTAGSAAGSVRCGGEVALRLLGRQYRSVWAAAHLRRLTIRTVNALAGSYDGNSGDLLFALVTFIELASRHGFIRPMRRDFAATGTLDADAVVGPVGGLLLKIEAALEPVPNGMPRGSIVFYPAVRLVGGASDVDEALVARALDRGIELRPVESLEEALLALGVEVLWWHKDQPPYRALATYQVEHNPVFFGRDDQVSTFLSRLHQVADAHAPGGLVEAGSGAGKSSFVQAGLLARLRIQRTSVSTPPEYAIWQPRMAGTNDAPDIGEAALARSVLSNWTTHAGVNSTGFIGLDHLKGVSRLDELAEALCNTGLSGRHLVWVVDQFEEIFTLKYTEDARIVFARFLANLQRMGVWVVGALRTEFKARFMAFADDQGRPLLVDVFERLMFPLARMPMESLGQVITEPAKMAGVTFEMRSDGVRLDALLRDDALGADSMPLVGYALNELWLRRSNVIEPGERASKGDSTHLRCISGHMRRPGERGYQARTWYRSGTGIWESFPGGTRRVCRRCWTCLPFRRRVKSRKPPGQQNFRNGSKARPAGS